MVGSGGREVRAAVIVRQRDVGHGDHTVGSADAGAIRFTDGVAVDERVLNLRDGSAPRLVERAAAHGAIVVQHGPNYVHRAAVDVDPAAVMVGLAVADGGIVKVQPAFGDVDRAAVAGGGPIAVVVVAQIGPEEVGEGVGVGVDRAAVVRIVDPDLRARIEVRAKPEIAAVLQIDRPAVPCGDVGSGLHLADRN